MGLVSEAHRLAANIACWRRGSRTGNVGDGREDALLGLPIHGALRPPFESATILSPERGMGEE